MGISFPGISAPQQAAPRRSQLDGLAELLLAVTQARQDIALKKEGLALERQRTDASVAESGERAKASAAQRAEEKRKREIEDLKLDAASKAAVLYQKGLSTPGGLTPQVINALRLEAAKDKKAAPYILDELDEFVKDGEGALAQHAERVTAQSNQNVATSTEAERITVGKSAPAVQKAQLDAAGAQLKAATQQLDASKATIRSMAINSWLNTPGSTIGQFRKDYSIQGMLGSLPDNTVSPAQKEGATISESQRTTLLGARQMLAAEALLTPAIAKAGSVSLASQYRRTTKSESIEAVLNTFSDPTQKAIVRSQLGFLGGYILVMSGKAANEGEIIRSARGFLEGYGDTDPASLQNAKFLRQSMMSSAFAVSQNLILPEDATKESLTLAKAMKMAPETIAFLTKMHTDALARSANQNTAVNPTAATVRGIRNEVFGDSTARTRPKPFPPR